MTGKLCEAEDPNRPGVKCVREMCVLYHRSADGQVWTEGALPMPKKRSDPVAVVGIISRARDKSRRSR